MRRSNYTIVGSSADCSKPLVIKDIGPWDQFMTVTNDAENVVKELAEQGLLPNGRQLLYYDSSGDFDEIVVENGQFKGFKPFCRG